MANFFFPLSLLALLKLVDSKSLDGPITSVNLLSSSFNSLHLIATSGVQPAVVFM